MGNDNTTFEFKSNIGKLPKPKDTTVDFASDRLVVSSANFRLDGSNNEWGINTTSLDELELRILSEGRILKHVVINRDSATGMDELLGGGRRYRAGKRLLANPNTPQEVVKELGKVPAFIYTDLSEEQKLFLVNDQDQKKFRQTEVLALIFRYLDQGKTWSEVASLVYRQWGEVTRADKILNEVDAIVDLKAKRKRIEKWLRGTIDEKFNSAHKIGQMCVKALMIEAAETDKLILTQANAPEGTPQEQIQAGPYCYLTQQRLKELEAAKAEDMKNGEWSAMVGGPKFQELWSKYHAEDYYGEKEPPKQKSLTREKILELQKTANSRVAFKVFGVCAGDKLDWKDSDNETALFESKKLSYLQQAGNFQDEQMKKLFYTIFVDTDFEKFQELLQTMLVPVTVG
jgi:hypothetical protein